MAQSGIQRTGPPDEEILLDRIPHLPTQADFEYMLAGQKRRMLDRTERGLDVDGRPFTPYSDRYQQRKENSGRDSGTVDLTWTGHMLQSIQIITEPDGITGRMGIYGADESTRAEAINEGIGNMTQRRFFDTSDDDVNQMAADMQQRLEDTLRNGR